MAYPFVDKAQILEMLLARDVHRGITSLQHLPKPECLAHNMEGARIVAECIKKGQEVLVVGDYDADGICASAVMIHFFRLLGYANMRLIIPHRFDDGYGVSGALLEKYANNAAVVVSVDNGITAVCAAKWCKEAGIPLIITDHHTPTDEIPNADVIIDPYLPECTFPQKAICGAVVAWYFCAALKQELGAKVDMSAFLEYLAIASIGDIMPLVGINRLLVKRGIERLGQIQTPLAQLLRLKYRHINAQTLGFYFVPLLNAAGRMASADKALALLVCENLTQANAIYDELLELNQMRKATQSKILQSAHKHLIEREHIVVSYAQGWHEGVLGIVASALANEYGKSAFVFNETEGVLKGSGRSYGGVNLIASITSLSEHLLGFGGHSGAVGLSLEVGRLEHFIESLQTHLVIEEAGADEVLGILDSGEIDEELMRIIERFEPFGAENPTPIFICNGLSIESIKPLGNEGKHFEYILYDKNNQTRLVGVEFFATCKREVGQCGNVHFELLRDEFKNRLKLKIIDFV
ncbi:single-stranded-DNA-specific exonuclease RecJ [uncultured Helicobacter sp.]|uniref:single-stranded-DNA-specific exonuclease RecJ n=1 Tax=uncultured Helicobacter sp. TaxID=175537 RepID=UPI00260185E4|nr:single-stranded-DNA-specific exonuclease RecJ [uncultured Helicobacter sp.]